MKTRINPKNHELCNKKYALGSPVTKEKVFLVCLLLGILLMISIIPADWTDDLNTDLQTWCKMDELSGNIAIDAYGGVLNGTYSGSPTLGVPGIIETSAFLSGGDYIVIADNPAFETDTFTFSIWVNATSSSAGGGNQRIFMTYGGDGDGPQVIFGDISTPTLRVDFYQDGGYSRLDADGDLALNVWVHLVFRRFNNGTLDLWVDGVKQADSETGTAGVMNTDAPLGIGADQDGGTTLQNGQLDEFGYWNTSLTDAQIAQLYNSGAGISWTAPLVDEEYPQFTNYQDNSGTLAGPGLGEFNITMTSTNGTVLLNLNETNITATNESYGGDIYNATYDFITETSYDYSWCSWGNGTDANFNCSETYTYSFPNIPSITSKYPLNNTHYNYEVTEFNYTYTGDAIDTCWYSTDLGDTNNTITCGTNVTGLTSSEGSNTWYLSINNSANTERRDIITFVMDTDSPIITWTLPSTSILVGDVSYTLDISVTDTYLDIVNVSVLNATNEYSYNNYSDYINITTFQIDDILTLEEGENIVEVCAGDSLTNSPIIEDDAQFTKRNAEETEYVLSNGNVVVRELVIRDALKKKLSAEFVNLNTIEEWVDEGKHYKTTWELDDIGGGSLEILMYDDLGNLELRTDRGVTRVIDTTRNYVWTYGDIEAMGYDVEYDTATPGQIEIKVTLGDYVVSGGRWIVDPLVAGLNNICENKTITLDTTSPVVTIAYPVESAYYGSLSLNLDYSVVEVNEGYCWYSLNSGDTNSTTQVCGTNWTGLTALEGSNTWTVYANDTIGNEGNSSVTFITDTIPPNIIIDFPANTTYNFNITELNYTSSEDGTCQYNLGNNTNKIFSNQSDGFPYSKFGGTNNFGIWGNGTNFWVSDTSEKIFYLNLNGEHLSNVSTASGTNPIGICGNDSDIWIIGDMAGANPAKFNHYTHNLTFIEEIILPSPVTDPRGIICNDSDVWIMDNYNTLIVQLSLNGTYIDETSYAVYASGELQGITSNKTDWWFMNGTAIIHTFANGTLIEIFNTTHIQMSEPRDLYTPDGINFWVTDTTDDFIYHLKWDINYSDPQTSNTNWTDLNATEGDNTWTVYCNDSAGNENTTSVTFFQDSNPPVVTPEVTDPDDGISTPFINDSYFNMSDVNLTANITDTYGIDNFTITIENDSGTVTDINVTEPYGTLEVIYGFVVTLADGVYQWFITAYDFVAGVVVSVVNTFTIDTTSPSVEITYILPYYSNDSLPINITFNYSVADDYEDTCWFRFEPIATNFTTDCNATMNSTGTINDEGYFDLTLFANDSANNIVSDTETIYVFYHNYTQEASVGDDVLEGEEVTFNLSVEMTNLTNSNAILVYNGTEYPADVSNTLGDTYIFKKNLVIPTGTGNGTGVNNTYYWMYSVKYNSTDFLVSNYTTSNQYLNVFTLVVGDCGTYSNVIFNLTLVDEQLQTTLGGDDFNTSVEIDLNLYPLGSTTSVLNFSGNYSEINPIAVCTDENFTTASYEMDVTIMYEASGYAREHYHIQNYTVTGTSLHQNITLYDLLSTDSTEFLVTFKGINFLAVEGALIDITRQYLAEGVFKTVEVIKTDLSGRAVGHFDRDGIVYTIIVKKGGVILATFDNVAVICADVVIGDCKINLNAFDTGTAIENWDEIGDLNYHMIFNETSREIIVTFSTVSGGTATVVLNATKYDMFGNNTICQDSLTSSSGTLTCLIPTSYGNVTAIAYLYSNEKFITTGIFSIAEDPGSLYGGGNRVILILLLLITIPLMMVTSVVGMVVGLLFGIIFASLLMFFEGSILGVGSAIIWVIVAGIILIWKVSSKEDNV